jgi:hypothetical protein
MLVILTEARSAESKDLHVDQLTSTPTPFNDKISPFTASKAYGRVPSVPFFTPTESGVTTGDAAPINCITVPL